jgi:hypothetical protein
MGDLANGVGARRIQIARSAIAENYSGLSAEA